jgi:hypothetical protein
MTLRQMITYRVKTMTTLDKRINKVMNDLFNHMKNEQELDDINKPRRYYYDRMDWIKINKSKRDDLYQVGLENLRVLVYQLGLFQQHILTDEEGNEINQIITE